MPRTSRLAFATLALVFAAAGCGSAEPPPLAPPPPVPASAVPVAAMPAAHSDDEPVPLLRLPTDVHPTKESVELRIDPGQARFSGVAEIAVTLDRPRTVLWLNGKGLHVTRATVTPDGAGELTAIWEQRHESGVASLTAPKPVSGRVTVRVAYDAAFDTALDGLHTVSEAGVAYAATQFSEVAARLAFPCFDEPGFKIPWDETLIVPKGAQAIANTREIGRAGAEGGAWTRVTFATTPPLPSYLVAFAVGPFDVVQAPDLPPSGVRPRAVPLRGIAPKGRGREMAYALAHAGELLAGFERYFGIAYPYDKLDLIAVPDKTGAMENAGAIMFAEPLLLVDEQTAPVSQRRGSVRVMAHEIAHQWVGDLVTHAWWDDIWLNEAFATWIAAKIVDEQDPKNGAGLALLASVQETMDEDGRVSARSIRQPITSLGDVENAFDAITYDKGGGVLAMFERWIGNDKFQKGVHDYLVARAWKNGTADDFLGALSVAAGRDVGTPFHSFLDQPGVPYIDAQLRCDGAPRLHLTQSRYLPVGSRGDASRTWQVPVCARAHVAAVGPNKSTTKEACVLLTEKEGDILLGLGDAHDACPDWVFPNVDAAGYYRYALAAPDLARLRVSGLPTLSARERVAYANSVNAGYDRALVPFADALEAAAPLADDPSAELASAPMPFVSAATDWLFGDPLRSKAETYGRGLYRAAYAKLGWGTPPAANAKPAAREDDERGRLRQAVLSFLVTTARDPVARAEAKKRGLLYLGGLGKDGALHPELVDPGVATIGTLVVGQEADASQWEALLALLAKSTDAIARRRLVSALSSAEKPELAARARDLALDPALRTTEVLRPLFTQFASAETREDAWQWTKDHYDALLARLPEHHGRTFLLDVTTAFCDEAHAKEVEDLFTPKVAAIEGGPRALASALEEIRLCVAKRKVQEPSVRAFFAKAR